MRIIVLNDGAEFAKVEVQDRSAKGTFVASSEEYLAPGEHRTFNVSRKRTIQVLVAPAADAAEGAN